MVIHAVYEDGVFRPRERVEIPNGSEVEFEPRIVGNGNEQAGLLDSIYGILRERFDSGNPDVSSRHNEHQP